MFSYRVRQFSIFLPRFFIPRMKSVSSILLKKIILIALKTNDNDRIYTHYCLFRDFFKTTTVSVYEPAMPNSNLERV